MSRALKFIALLVCLCLAVPAVYGQGKCTMQTITGTYAVYIRGSSSIIDLNPQTPPPPIHWAAAIAPLTVVGKISITPDGTFTKDTSFYWGVVGSINAGVDPIPVAGKVTQLHEDCTGVLEYTIQLPGSPPAPVIERFIVFDNGREFRSIASQTVLPTQTWATTGRRISRSVKPFDSCGPQTSHGVYVLVCEGYYPLDQTTGFAEAAMFRFDIGLNGDYTGTLVGKIGPLFFEFPSVNGTITVNPDCSASGTLRTPWVAPDATNHARGVFFDEGKEFYWMPIVTTGLPDGQPDLPAMPELCLGTRIDR